MILSMDEVQVYKENAHKDMCEGTENRYEELLLKRIVAMADTIEAQQQEIKKLKDDFAALNSLYDAENETFTEIVQKEKELLKEIDQKDTALERAARGVKSIIEQYTTDFTEEELLSDALCPREKVVLEYANETLEVLQEALGSDTP